MTPRSSLSILTTAFSALPRADKLRLRWHLEKKTPICCGKDAEYFVNRKGAG
jgi:hypothetical protein